MVACRKPCSARRRWRRGATTPWLVRGCRSRAPRSFSSRSRATALAAPPPDHDSDGLGQKAATVLTPGASCRFLRDEFLGFDLLLLAGPPTCCAATRCMSRWRLPGFPARRARPARSTQRGAAARRAVREDSSRVPRGGLIQLCSESKRRSHTQRRPVVVFLTLSRSRTVEPSRLTRFIKPVLLASEWRFVGGRGVVGHLQFPSRVAYRLVSARLLDIATRPTWSMSSVRTA